MRKLFAILSACLISASVFAQNVTNVVALQEGNNIVVTYYLDKYTPSVSLTVSTDGGATFSAPVAHISGDVTNVQPGVRSIVWDVLSDWDELSSDNIVFALTPKRYTTANSNGHAFVDLGLSVKWATCNLGAGRRYDKGHYFIWRDEEHDSARAVWGGSWRLPTKAEFQELMDNCNSYWVKNYNGTGVSGRVFRSRVPGYTDKYIFLPAGGYGRNGAVTYSGYCGYYWTGSHYHDDYSWAFYFSSGLVSPNYYLKNQPQLIRPVLE